MIGIIENASTYSRPVVALFDTYDEAVAYAHNTHAIEFIEADEDNADCADFYTKSGCVFSIEPTTRLKSAA